MIVLPYSSETLHIALLSLPQDKSQQHIEALIANLYEHYKREIKKYSNIEEDVDENLFSPLKYYVLGNYDIAFISLINNYKFAQKQLTPHIGEKESDSFHETNSFQIITGSCPLISDLFSPAEFFKRKQKEGENFICISNLKINNKLLIGTGNELFAPLLKLINDKVGIIKSGEKYADNYFLQQSHSWFEISLILFSNSIESFEKNITDLRNIALNDLVPYLDKKDKIGFLRKSLFGNMKLSDSKLDAQNPHLFSDTHSYFGISEKWLNNEQSKHGEEDLSTLIEWQVKPGHFGDLRRILNEIGGEEGIFSDKEFLLTGKTDYLIYENKDKLSNNIRLIKFLKENRDIYKYVRKVKTKVLFKTLEHRPAGDDSQADFKNWMQNTGIAMTVKEINLCSANLKKLKISRNIRNKINKIFYNYNNGIQDPVLFTYFLDFRIFISNLTRFIEQEVKTFDEAFETVKSWRKLDKVSVNSLEDILVKWIDIFDEGYNTRMLNSHNYEDITDFDLDFNSSVQQLLSIYNTICADISNLFYERGNHGPVVQLYLKNTVSSSETINYDVYHLTSPEFVFFTITKEILNKFVYANLESARDKIVDPEKLDKTGTVKEILQKLDEEVKQTRLSEFSENRLINFEYLFLDSIRYIHSCNLDFDLYQYWSWAYSFQNTSMYDRIGTFNEEHFKKELARLIFVARMFKVDTKKITCPLPEIYFLWERHFKSINENIGQFFEKSKQVRELKSFILTIFRYPPLNKKLTDIQLSKEEDRMVEDKTNSLYAFVDNETQLKYNKNLGAISNQGEGQLVSHIAYTVKQTQSIISKLKEGKPVYCEADDVGQYYYINTLIYSCLKLIYDQNKSVCMLRRSWKTGAPLISFIKKSKNENLYFIDQFGGIFFANFKKSADYFVIRNAVIQSLWNYSLLCKKNLYFSKNEE